MIVFSEQKIFTLEKYVSGSTREKRVDFGTLAFHKIENYGFMNINVNDTQLLIKKMWPVFKGAPGLQPFGQSSIYPDSLFFNLSNYGTFYHVNDWNRPLELNQILPVLPAIPQPMNLSIQNGYFYYDSLNINSVYDGKQAEFSMYMEIEVAE